MGKLSGYIQQSGYYGFKIDAQFNDDGVITTGTGGITYGRFENAGAAPTETVVGKLTGIIGDRGALGAFHSDGATSNQILGFAGGFRANGFSEDELTVLRKCVLDPFHGQCSEDKFDDLKEARIELCIEGDNASDTNQIECHNAVVAEGCILNPFQTTCTGEESDFNQYSEAARTNRIAFCDSSVNAKKPFCTVGTIVADVCADNPFHAICGSDYDEKANDRLILCRQDDVVAGDSRCAQAEPIIDICKLTPFEDECTWGAFDETRKDLITACHDTGECAAAVLELPNAATWVNTITTRAENPLVLGDGAGTISSENQFLKNIEDALGDTTRIEIIRIYNRTTYKSLNLKMAKFNGTALGGDEEDGMAYFRGRSPGQSNNYDYVGILSTTDLGAPLTTETGTASWVGHFRQGYYTGKDFVLGVNFDDDSIEAFVAGITDRSYGYHIKGDYDANGVISGTVTRGIFTDSNRDKPDFKWSYDVSTLIGLIGKEGAVGVFVGTYTNNGGFVARPADLVVNATTNKNAETFLNETCMDNPLHEFCYLSDEREARITLCSTNDNALINTKCIADVIKDPCILHPFDEGCVPTAISHYQIARKNRSAFCNNSADTVDNFDTLCKGDTGVEHAALCSYDPFNRICVKQSDAFCANEPDHLYCGNAIYDNARKAVCKADSSHTGCTDAHKTSSNVTAISWLAGLYKDNGVVPQTELGTLRPRAQFLQDTEDGLDNGDLRIRSHSDAARSGFLNFNTATFDGLELDGDVADGAAFFYGSNGKSYAGIFSSTDLGAPVTETKGTAKWYGQFQVGNYFKTDFTLDITFGAGSTGTVEAFVHSNSNFYYLLKGKFDSNGVISGTVARDHFLNHDKKGDPDGILTGLIGTEGAVGAFTGNYHYSGGFVAVPEEDVLFDPNVKFSDWVRSFDKPPYPTVPWVETQQARFLQGKETGLSTFNLGALVRPSPLTLAHVNTDGEVADGVAYMSGAHRRDYNFQTRSYASIEAHHVAGILSGTNLGAVLGTAGAGGATMTTWKGRLGLIADGSEVTPRDIDLTVDFTNKEISHSSAIGGAHFVNLNANWKSGVGYDGVLKGTITYNAGAALVLDGTDSKGKVSGLIGKDGVVAAFISDEGSVTHYAGGFVAVPSAVFSRIVIFSDWARNFRNTSPLLDYGLPNETQQTRFLQATETGLSRRNLYDVVPRTLTLADDDFGGDRADGVAYMSGTQRDYSFDHNTQTVSYDAETTHHYSGLLSGTNLG
ncbi:MAG: hypothetical protein K0U41_09325, partial [Gammaproteobacteria bacterium]|nr:hypothetical protein [Gammaproteobacteria bacterium]